MLPRFQLSLVLTHACNLACSYCYMGEHVVRAMPVEVVERAVAMAFEQGEAVDVGFFGGEPLLAYPMLMHAARVARDRGRELGRPVRFQVTTNGTLLDAERARELVALGVRVTLSIDGDREAHDAGRRAPSGASSFDRAVEGALHLTAAGTPVEIVAVVHPGNVRRLAASVRFLVELGATLVIVNPAFEATWSDADLAAFAREQRKVATAWGDAWLAGRPFAVTSIDSRVVHTVHGGRTVEQSCSVGRRNVAVAPSGNLYPCERLVADDSNERFRIGSLHSGVDVARVGSIARGPAHDECGACSHRAACSGGCVCANVAETGQTDIPGGVQCWYERISTGIAERAARRLLERGCKEFVRAAYGGAIEAAIPRKRKLPVAVGTRGAEG